MFWEITVWPLYFAGLNFRELLFKRNSLNKFREFVLPMGVTAQWLKFSLNKFRERFQIREIREIKDPRNISAIRYEWNNRDRPNCNLASRSHASRSHAFSIRAREKAWYTAYKPVVLRCRNSCNTNQIAGFLHVTYIRLRVT